MRELRHFEDFHPLSFDLTRKVSLHLWEWSRRCWITVTIDCYYFPATNSLGSFREIPTHTCKHEIDLSFPSQDHRDCDTTFFIFKCPQQRSLKSIFSFVKISIHNRDMLTSVKLTLTSGQRPVTIVLKLTSYLGRAASAINYTVLTFSACWSMFELWRFENLGRTSFNLIFKVRWRRWRMIWHFSKLLSRATNLQNLSPLPMQPHFVTYTFTHTHTRAIATRAMALPRS